MPSLSQIRTALVSTITTAVPALKGSDKVPESIIVPAILVAPRAADFQRAFGRGLDGYTFDVIVLVSGRDDTLAQGDLDVYVNGFGSSSIRQAVFNARTLGIDVDASVTGMADYGANWTFGATDYVGARLTVEVLTSGTS